MEILDNKDILFIINPNSGSRKARRIINEIYSLDINIPAVVSNNVNELEEIFKLNIDKFKAFIIVGGDGTVNETLKYLYNRNDKLLGVLPAGSGNGFSRELGFKRSVKSLIEDTKKKEFIDIDVLSINNDKFINIAGIGFDSFVAHSFQSSQTRGLRNYIMHTIRSVFKFKSFNANIMIDKELIQDKFQMITIANTRQFGNSAIIAPKAKPNDGIFELVLVKPFPFYIYPFFVIRVFLGTLKNSKYVRYYTVNESVNIKSDFKKYHIDGEPQTFTEQLSVKMMENKLRLVKTSHNKL